jgi:hypothetical protein
MVAHWADVVQAVHTPLAPQTGAVAGQLALVRHPTHAPVVEQVVRAGSFKPAHWTDVVQAAQAPAAQIGAAAGHVALVRHCTHLFVVVSQTGVAPAHVELSTHCTHAPVVAHAARAGSARVAHWAEVAQAAHVPAREQIGAVPGHVAVV